MIQIVGPSGYPESSTALRIRHGPARISLVADDATARYDATRHDATTRYDAATRHIVATRHDAARHVVARHDAATRHAAAIWLPFNGIKQQQRLVGPSESTRICLIRRSIIPRSSKSIRIGFIRRSVYRCI